MDPGELIAKVRSLFVALLLHNHSAVCNFHRAAIRHFALKTGRFEMCPEGIFSQWSKKTDANMIAHNLRAKFDACYNYVLQMLSEILLF